LSAKSKAVSPPKKLVLGDDAIDSADADWFDFDGPAEELARNLYDISKSSGVCCGVLGSWGSGKSSFMKLTARHAKQVNPKVCITWFTAWDPGGIKDLGDAMLLRVFGDIAADNKDLTKSLKSLKEAVGLRKSMRQRAGKALEIIEKTTPQSARPVVGAAAGLLQELDTPRRVQDSFDELVKWLEKNDWTVFLFIDDIDRAAGEQIRDLLSELKVYVSHPRIVGVIGFDEDYVLNALNAPVLPVNIEPRKFLEKIVTVRKSLPVPAPRQLTACAAKLLESLLGLELRRCERVAEWATRLCAANPRRLKTLVLSFSNSLHLLKYEELDDTALISALLVCCAEQMGLLADSNLRATFDSGNEDDIKTALGELRTKRPDKAQDVDILSTQMDTISPQFEEGLVSALRFGPRQRLFHDELRADSEEAPAKTFDWRTSLNTILPKAIRQGFTLGSAIALGSAKVTIPTNTKGTSDFDDFGFFREMQAFFKRRYDMGCRILLDWKDGCVAVFVSSEFSPRTRSSAIRGGSWIQHMFDDAPQLVVGKAFIVWIIDDGGYLTDRVVQAFIAQAKIKSKGLVHPLIFVCTRSSQVPALLSYLLDVCTGAKNTD
jgi:hypothetical protein